MYICLRGWLALSFDPAALGVHRATGPALACGRRALEAAGKSCVAIA
jgi:hypothetical protein